MDYQEDGLMGKWQKNKMETSLDTVPGGISFTKHKELGYEVTRPEHMLVTTHKKNGVSQLAFHAAVTANLGEKVIATIPGTKWSLTGCAEVIREALYVMKIRNRRAGLRTNQKVILQAA